jgi:hypothetical protein
VGHDSHDLIERATFARFGARAHEHRELVRVMFARLDFVVAPTAEQRPEANEGLHEHCHRIGLCMRLDQVDHLADWAVVGDGI